MIDTQTLALFDERYKSLSADGKGDDYKQSTRTMTLGLVVSGDDPLEQGRLQIFCPALNDNPKKIFHLPWAAYVTPFGGSIDNSAFARGVGDEEAGHSSDGAIHYGFWGVPEVGAHVLVGCIDGDPRRRFYVGSIPEHQETHTQFTGRFVWDSAKGTPDGPLTSKKKPIQPLYDNLTAAFVDRNAREWKTRGADYQPMAVSKSGGSGSPSSIKGDEYLDESYSGISSEEKDRWVRDYLGAHGYDWSGNKKLGAFKASRVFGMSTPGNHAFSMDDRPFNSRIKFRTATGHMVLMDDTNERIYIMTNKGKSWVEMDSSGNVDVYSDLRVSIGAASDINLTSGGSIRMHADDGIHMYAGHAPEVGTIRGPLEYIPKRGEIRIESEDDVSILGNNIRTRSVQNTYNEIGINRYEMVGQSSFLDVQEDINIRTLNGDYIQTVARNLCETILNDAKRLSYGKSAISSNGDNEVFSFSGGLSMGGLNAVDLKAAKGDVNVEAGMIAGENKSFNVRTQNTQAGFGSDGANVMTTGKIASKAGGPIEMEVNPTAAASLATPSGVYGVAAALSAIKISATSVDIQGATDVNFKSVASGYSSSYVDMVTTINSTAIQVNMLTYYTAMLTVAISALASAVGESFSMPYTFDTGSLSSSIFSDALPVSLTQLYPTLSDLNTAIGNTGIGGIALPLDINEVVDTLQGNTTLLSALGLSTSLSFPINPSVLGALDILAELGLTVDLSAINALNLPKFRELVDAMMVNTSGGSISTPPTLQQRPPLGAI